MNSWSYFNTNNKIRYVLWVIQIDRKPGLAIPQRHQI